MLRQRNAEEFEEAQRVSEADFEFDPEYKAQLREQNERRVAQVHTSLTALLGS